MKFLLQVAFIAISLTQTVAIVNQSVVGFWPFTDLTGINDVSGNEFHGETYNNAQLDTNVTGPFGVLGTAYTLSSANSAIFIRHPELFFLDKDFTIALMVKWTSGMGPLMEHVRNDFNNVGSWMGFHVWANHPSNERIFVNTLSTQSTSAPCSQGVWHNVWIIYTVSNSTVHLYCDSNLVLDPILVNYPSGNSGYAIGWRGGSSTSLQGQFSCYSIFSSAFDLQDRTRLRAICNQGLFTINFFFT